MSKIITTRSVKWVVGEVDQPVFSDTLTAVGIVDEGDGEGEFVQVSQSDPDGITMHIKISPEEWPELQNAINHAIRMCQEAKP
jgi:hypothetical protein